MSTDTLTPERIIEALRPVEDPELHRSIVDLGMAHVPEGWAPGVELGGGPGALHPLGRWVGVVEEGEEEELSDSGEAATTMLRLTLAVASGSATCGSTSIASSGSASGVERNTSPTSSRARWRNRQAISTPE